MDMLLNAGDSFQDMLDLDIKSEIDTVLGFSNDFTSLNFNFHDAPTLDLDESPSEINMWFSGSNHSNSNFNIDFIGSEAAAMMVNPNSVMPLALVTVPPKTTTPIIQNSPRTDKKSLEFSNHIKVENIKTEDKKPIAKTIKISTPKNNMYKNEIKTNHSLLNIKNAIQKQINNSNFNVNNVKIMQRKQQFNNRHHFEEFKAFPKPAYSYSCLIAMALKNSRNGSLPVSEIYNFMCEHFPYFKTAPNGWKNSVRHNLSLNKCFEKIEKPAVSGAQRKGCLWAMNPAKISKMDDEVQKWSRKDPTAIRKAMVNPEHLEALERGELKYTCRSRIEDDIEDTGTEEEDDNSSDVEGSDVEIEETTENELENEFDFVNVNALEDEAAFDIEEVTDAFYSTDGEPPTIKIEMEVLEDELLESSYSRKRSRDILELDESYSEKRYYQIQPPTRRKTAYLIKNE